MSQLTRYSLITQKFPREFLLLQGTGCRHRRCAFCDYYDDVSASPFSVNRPVLDRVTGQTGVLDVINSGSCTELDPQTVELLAQVLRKRRLSTLWLEAHWMYRDVLARFAENFPGVTVKYRIGAETFDSALRRAWNKGIPGHVGPREMARFFQGACLLVGVEGQTLQMVKRDVELALSHFEYVSVNLFNENSTPLRRDALLTRQLAEQVFPALKENPRVELLVENTDLGVG